MRFIPALAVLAFATAASAQAPPTQVSFIGSDGASRGTGTLTASPGGVLIHLEMTGVTPGWHGVHLHAKGICDAPEFKGAGAHINMGAMKHGLENPMGAEDGDLPNIYAGADGKVMAELFSTKVSMNGGGARAPLMDADGSAIVVHAMPDNQTSQPIGDSGARIACAVIAPMK